MMPLDPKDDFPAAHSMDTVWFAVDREGHVAAFSTGSEGAVPQEASNRDVDEDVMTGLASLPAKSHPIYDREGHIRSMGEDNRHSGLEGMSTLVFVADPQFLAPLVLQKKAHSVPSLQSHAFVVEEGCEEFLEDLHSREKCLACRFWSEGEFDRDDEEDPLRVARRAGLFVFDHRSDDWLAGTYGRSELPARPLHVKDLSPELAETVKQCVFENLSFAQQDTLQPMELKPCHTWGPAWLSADGKRIRPVPGKEKEFKNEGWKPQDLGPDGEFHDVPPEGPRG